MRNPTISSHYVLNSKADDYYVVSQHEDFSFSCSCPGWRFRRRCRHIDEVKVTSGLAESKHPEWLRQAAREALCSDGKVA